MRIVLATPLYPPDIAEPAPYLKELAKRLSARHAIMVVAYTRLPEHVPGVSMITVDKRRPLPLRLFSYFLALREAARHTDIIYAENGASVELPVALLSLFSRRPIIMHIGDRTAHRRAQATFVLKYIERLAFSRARDIVDVAPMTRPEILPFHPFPAEALAAYEQSWNEHLHVLDRIFSHATT